MSLRRIFSSFVYLSIGLFVYLSIGLLRPPVAYADQWWTEDDPNPYWNEDPKSFATDLYKDGPTTVNSKRFVSATVINTLLSLTTSATTGENSALRQVGSGIAMLISTPPVRTHEYLAYMGAKAGFIPQAYAQTAGFSILTPIQKIWVSTRNIAYLVTSLILIVIGFMIMLRKKIDAQTVIGVQQALPNLVVTLLLVTFSYAIAGFVIDMIYFTLYAGVKLLALPGSSIFVDDGSNAIKTIQENNVFSLAFQSTFGGGATGGTVSAAATAVSQLIEDTLGGLGTIVSGGGLFSNGIAWTIFAVAILYSVFKLFFSLLMSYIQIIALSILGPLQLMFGALPGNDAFSKWIRNLLANAMAFPAAALMFMFAAALTSQSGTTWDIAPGVGFVDPGAGVKWVPPLLSGGWGGSGGHGSSGTTTSSLSALFGIGILMMTPKVVDMVKEAIQAPENKYLSAIGEATGFGGKGPAYIGRTAGQGREYNEALRYADSTNRDYDPAFMQQLMFTNPELYTRVSRGLSGGIRGKILQGVGYSLGIGGRRR